MALHNKIKIKNHRFQTWPTTIALTLLMAFFSCFLAQPAAARIFNPHNIIEDEDLFDPQSLSKTAVQKFLERENSVLARFSQIVGTEVKKASDIIWEAAQRYSVNPKFLLADLEKEQALVSKTQATEKALDWATGFGCYGGGCKEKYRGFYNQVDATASTQEVYRQKASQFSFQVNRTATTNDGYPVRPNNQATANLYIYTPYVGYSPELGVTQPYGGNRLFWRIWHRYFSPQPFVDGQVVRSGDTYWLIEGSKKRKFSSTTIFLADHQSSDATPITSDQLAAYPDGPDVVFKPNTVVRGATTGQLFLITGSTKRPIADEAALALLSDVQIAVNPSDITVVNDADLDFYWVGSIITSASVYPEGKLFRDENNVLWFVQDGLKHLVYPAVWHNRFNDVAPTAATSQALDSYVTGGPVKLKDGTFVTSNGTYYLISNGERMRIQDVALFNRLFGQNKKDGAVTVDAAVLGIHDAGEMIDYIDDTIQDATPTDTGTVPTTGTYATELVMITPDSVELQNTQATTAIVTFKNTGTATWSPATVQLLVTDKNATTSSFGITGPIMLNQLSVPPGGQGNFTIPLTAPAKQVGILQQQLTLVATQNTTPTTLASIGKLIIVKEGIGAEIVSQNVPAAVNHTWKPVKVVIKIKNTSKDTIWLSRRTALEIYNADNKPSVFYDPNDWVRKEVAAVPLNKTTIKPGEVGEFKFTLDPRKVKRGVYTLRFKLKLLDKNKTIILNGADQWERLIRVD